MFLPNPHFVLALLAASSFGNFLVSVDGKCKIEPVDGHVNWPSTRKKIKKNDFKKCKELVTICIPPEVESIHNTAFVKSGLDLTKLYEVPCYTDPPILFSFKGPLQIEERSVEGEPAAVLTAPPTDYSLQFTIELKSIPECIPDLFEEEGIVGEFASIILLTNNGREYVGAYGQLVPGVYILADTTEIWVGYGDDQNGARILKTQPLELNKEYTVLIKVYGTTATIIVNGYTADTQPVGLRSQLNDVELYLGDPYHITADVILSDITFNSLL